MRDQDREFMRQRHLGACVKMQCVDGEADFLLGSGGMVGDHGGPKEFMKLFAVAIDKWVDDIRHRSQGT
eukprot:6780461-Lingulodinium_polyedra.AAC.1